jgi:DNA repair protein RadA/Sms
LKNKSVFVCQNCGFKSPKWLGRCSSCNSWNSFLEELVAKKNTQTTPKNTPEIYKLSEIREIENIRVLTQDNELNRVLGGGIVPGSVILLGGEPGIGKSTILLQLALNNQINTIYVSGEESLIQIKLRANRLNISNEITGFVNETDVDNIIELALKEDPGILIIDSIQTLKFAGEESSAGTITQIRECSQKLIDYAKSSGCCVFLIGHINKEGYIAGPKVLEHMVDTVLYFEGDKFYSYRILRSIKNRFGSVAEIGIYEMNSGGLIPVDNPSEILLTQREHQVSGISIASILEGARPIMIEIQALVSTSAYGNPQRTATGFDSKRLSMLLAVLEKKCDFKMGLQDVFLNIAGGLKILDPSADLAVLAAIISSYQDSSINNKTTFAGEAGLSGEIRAVDAIEKRISEAEKLGFEKVYVSGFNKKNISKKYNIEIAYVNSIHDLVKEIA